MIFFLFELDTIQKLIYFTIPTECVGSLLQWPFNFETYTINVSFYFIGSKYSFKHISQLKVIQTKEMILFF